MPRARGYPAFLIGRRFFPKYWTRLLGLLWSFAVPALLSGCGEPPLYKQQGYVFGTLVDISIAGEPDAKARQDADHVLAEFDRLNRELHAWQPSDMERLNEQLAHAPVSGRITPELAAILQDATRYEVQGDHLFDPAIGNLIRLWGFQSDTFVPRLPDPAEIKKLIKANPRMTDLVISGTHFHCDNPAVRIDLGGYKGFALDVAANYLRSQGVQNALVNIGGNIIALGQHGGRPWKVGIQNPRGAGAIATLELHDGEAIGTSGDYQRYFVDKGVRYCHIIDPRTGWPVQDTQAVTLLTSGPKAGTRSDAPSKPIFIAGAAHWREMAAREGIANVMRIDASGRIEVTASMATRLEWLDKSAHPTVLP